MKHFAFLLVLSALFCCKRSNECRIEGQLPDRSFDDEFVFMVPFENATKEKVDSVPIINRRFIFHGPVRKNEIFIIRTRPLLRLQLQEILIAKEPGTIRINFGRSSTVSGTSLNDSLQHWKNHKILFDQNMNELLLIARSAQTDDDRAIHQQIDSLQYMTEDFHFNFIKNNRGNAVGDCILKLMGSSFSPSLKEKLAAPNN